MLRTGGETSYSMLPEVIAKSVASRAWYKHPPEIRKKISASKKGKPLHANTRAASDAWSRSPENIERIRAIGTSRKGVKASQALRDRLSEILQDQWASGTRYVPLKSKLALTASSKARIGIPLTDEHKAKVGAASRRHVRTEEWKSNISLAIKEHWKKRKAERNA